MTKIIILQHKTTGDTLVVIDDILEGVFKVPFVPCLAHSPMLPLTEVLDKFLFPISTHEDYNIVKYVKAVKSELLEKIEYYQREL